MIFYYIRHGDPVYDPDSLTPLGHKQAVGVAKRLSMYGLDRIYSSTSNRAIQTAEPTCDILKKEMTFVDFANESYAWRDFSLCRDGKTRWVFHDEFCMDLFTSDNTIRYNEKWYEHPKLKEYNFGKGVHRVCNDVDAFFAELGYEHIRGTGRYKVVKPNDERVALFAHQGFGMAFLSTVLDIPYPLISTHFDMCHSGMTVIHFKEIDGYTAPKVLTLSSDSHIYKEGYGTNYNNEIRI